MKKITFIFALLCASVMGWAIDWSGYDWIGDGAGGGAYSNKYKLAADGDQGVVNIQHPGFATADGIYTTFTGAVTACDLGAGNYDAQGGGLILHLNAFTAKETVVNVTTDAGGGKNYTFTVYYADGTTGGGGGDPDPGTGGDEPDPEPAGIDWNDYSWIGNGSGNAAYTDKFKMTLATGQTVVNIQQPGFATAPGIYTTLPAGIISCSLPSSAYDVQGAGMILHVDYFTYKETEITVVHGTGTAVFTVYYADGIEGSAEPEPEEIYDVNFALQSQGGVASAKSGNDAGLANNGNTGDRWWSETAEMTDAEKNDQWWQVDLGQRRIFNTIQIVWEGAWGKSFDIQISDDGDAWTTVKEIRNQNIPGPFPYEQTIDLETNKTARYVRFQGVERGTQWAYSFWEFRVLLPGVSVLTSIDLTAPAQIAEVGGAGVALTAQPKDQNGQNMEAEISWEITPAAAGHMSGNTFIPDQVGSASIRAYSGEVYSPVVTIAAYEGTNVALNKTDDEITVSGYDTTDNLFPRFAVDDNDGSLWSAFHGETGSERIYDAWISVDLGAYYDINLIAIRWEGACSRHYHVDFSADGANWRTAYNAGWDAIATHWEYLIGTAEDATKVRYVRVWSTEAVSQYGTKIMALKVYGIPWVPSGDTEAPVMGEASLVSNTYTEAVLSVAATDNVEVARFHVVDNANGIDANYVANAGQITITGLTDATDYNFTITAIDAAGLESENSAVVPVSIPFNTEANLALNKPCEGGYYDNNPAEVAGKANDGDNGTSWVTYGDHAIALDWWVVDLGKVYNLTNITALWANDAYATQYILQARVDAPTAEDKANDAAWVTLETVSGVTAGEERSTNVSGVGRYVRFRALAHTGFFRLREFRVYGSGVATVDTEKPVMSSASLVSAADNHAIIAVAATDNVGVAKFHVVDAGNSFDAEFVAEAGNITVTGLTGGTNYNFTITAIDFFGNESANSKSVVVATTAHYTEPQAACAAPTWDAELVKAIYSPTYEATCGFDAWGSGSVFADDTYGKKCTVGNKYFGMVGFTLNCLMMEKVHFDIWVENDLSIRFVPIWGGAEQGITRNLVGQQWNSIDIDLTDYTGVTNWGNITQFKLDEMPTNFNLWIANAYFYREAPYVDTEAPTNVSASKVAEGFYSVSISAQAEDNSGAVSFKVMNGENQVATGAAATGVATTIVVNGLAAGTNYNFNVIAYDEAGNEADPIAVAAATKALPAPAPAPDLAGKRVVNVFSDAMEGSKTIHSGGWGETTQVEWLDIAEGDKVFYARNFNYAGWHSWGADIDATGMTYLHVDVYSTGMTQVSVTPISQGHEGVANITLTPNAWTSADIALSEYAANNIDWSAIFQFKFMNPVDGNELLIDNVYFYRPADYTRAVTAGRYGTICLPQAGDIVGATLYEIADYANGMIYVDEVEGGVMEAGKPYIFQATSAQLNVYYTSATVEATAGSANGLHGFYNLENENAQFDIEQDAGNYILYQNQYWLVSGRAAYINNYRAYIKIGEINYTAPSPSRRRVAMTVNGEQTATSMDAINATDAPVKMVINGQLFILRGEKMYDTTGRLVK